MFFFCFFNLTVKIFFQSFNSQDFLLIFKESGCFSERRGCMFDLVFLTQGAMQY